MENLNANPDFESKPGSHDVSGIPTSYYKTEVPRKLPGALKVSLVLGVIGALLIPAALARDNQQINQQINNPTPECVDCDKPPTPQVPSQEPLGDFLPPNVDPRFVIPPDLTPIEQNNSLQIA